jgi:hypothetical protein
MLNTPPTTEMAQNSGYKVSNIVSNRLINMHNFIQPIKDCRGSLTGWNPWLRCSETLTAINTAGGYLLYFVSYVFKQILITMGLIPSGLPRAAMPDLIRHDI